MHKIKALLLARMEGRAFLGTVGLAFVCLVGGGCNRATVRIPGASLAFPATATGFVAKTNFPLAVVVTLPSDLRPQHYGERVAGRRWASCRTDALGDLDAAKLVQERLQKELQTSRLFSTVKTGAVAAEDLVLRTEIHSFSAQARGVLLARIVGMTSLRVVMEKNGKPIMERKLESVVTDGDKEYSGSQVTFIEQAMRVTMADSLRELMKEMLRQIESELARQAPPS